MKPDVFVATPLHDGRVDARYMIGMLSVVAKWGPQRVMLGMRPGSLLPPIRDNLTVDFLKSGARFMLCVDSDQGWNVAHLEALMAHDVEAVSALNTRREVDRRTMPAVWNGLKGIVNGCELIGAHYVGAGFLLLRRDAIHKMVEHYRESLFYPGDGEDIKNGAAVALWHPICRQGDVTYLGEDYSFCKRARDIGISFWVDPNVRVEHIGPHVFTPDFDMNRAAWEKVSLDAESKKGGA